MDGREYRSAKKRYRAEAKERRRELKAARKARRGLPRAERREALGQERAEVRDWKRSIARVEDRRDRRAQRKAYRWFRRAERRWIWWTVLAVILVALIALFAWWYTVATKPMTPDQRATRDASERVALEVQAEGSVLLRNEHEALPLAGSVAVFGAGSVTPIYSGGGAGGISPVGVTSLYTGLERAGVEFDPELRNVYGNFATTGKASTKEWSEPGEGLIDALLPAIKGFIVSAPDEMPVAELPDGAVSRAAERSDTAIYVLSRAGMEGFDLKPEDLRLGDDERDTIELLDAHFEHVVILLNTTNPVELGFVEEYEHVDGVLWIGGTGEVGATAVGRILTGETNPSGRLTDTYAYDIEDHPATANTGDFAYVDEQGEKIGRYFTRNLEGIYVGYRYFETFAPEQVQYPFGFGLSYTDFDWQLVSTRADADRVEASVKVTNTGRAAGKDVVQLYAEAPYTPGGIEKPRTVLVGYGKTGELEPGASETLTVGFDTRDLAAYDEHGAGAWVLDAGTYAIDVSRSVSDRAARFDYTQPERVVFDTDSATGAPVENRFDGIDGGLAYLSRADERATMPRAPEGADFAAPEGLLDADFAHTPDPDLEAPATGADNGIELSDLRGLDADDPKWDAFLDQFTEDELVKLAGNGGYWSVPIERLGVPRTTMYDGPTSIRSFLGSWASLAYPIPAVMAASWNDGLAEEVGSAMGAEAQAYGVDAAYAPSLDIHRSPLGGRNFEYLSEDPLLIGRMGAAYSTGMQSEGTVTVIKHFAANLQETNRAAMGLYVWTNEQTMRELYLKPFEIAVKEADAYGVMSSFNRIGTTWAGGDPALLTDVLRDEWGFDGFVISDAGVGPQGGHFDALQAVQSGNDVLLGLLVDFPGDGRFEKQLKHYLEEDRAGTLTALRESARHVCQYVLETNRME